ncbi:MAG: hypothetical protein OD814_000796 [Candidatus Alkanophagales archaeon MCA70_species_1]|nr:hypothetical protein [Candidatus Alkanophaga volatiphilum]
MVQELVQKLVSYTQEMFDKLYGFTEKRYPANVAFTIFEILQMYENRIEPLDDIYLRKRFIDIYEKLIETTYSHFLEICINLYCPISMATILNLNNKLIGRFTIWKSCMLTF